jgi:hypothetical protein
MRWSLSYLLHSAVSDSLSRGTCVRAGRCCSSVVPAVFSGDVFSPGSRLCWMTAIHCPNHSANTLFLLISRVMSPSPGVFANCSAPQGRMTATTMYVESPVRFRDTPNTAATPPDKTKRSGSYRVRSYGLLGDGFDERVQGSFLYDCTVRLLRRRTVSKLAVVTGR